MKFGKIKYELERVIKECDVAINPTMIFMAIMNLDEIVRKEKNVLPKQLVHFIERRSYQKALTWIQENNIPCRKSNCKN